MKFYVAVSCPVCWSRALRREFATREGWTDLKCLAPECGAVFSIYRFDAAVPL